MENITIIVRGTYTEHLRFIRLTGACIMKQDPTTTQLLNRTHILRTWENNLTADGIAEYTLDATMWKAIKPELLDRLSEDDLLAGWDYWDTDCCTEYILF